MNESGALFPRANSAADRVSANLPGLYAETTEAARYAVAMPRKPSAATAAYYGGKSRKSKMLDKDVKKAISGLKASMGAGDSSFEQAGKAGMKRTSAAAKRRKREASLLASNPYEPAEMSGSGRVAQARHPKSRRRG